MNFNLSSTHASDVNSDLPTGWTWATISNTGDYINGLAFRPEDWGQVGKPIIRIQNLTNPEKPFNYTEREVDEAYLVPKGTILVSWSATLDAFVWRGEEAVLNQHIFKVVPAEQTVDKGYLFHLLRFAIEQMQRSEHLHGSTMKHINRGPFLAHRVPLAPLPEQRRIVARIEELLSQVDAGVAGLRALQTKLKRYRAAILKAACDGTLVPTEAELARQENRAYEPAADLLTRVLAERRARWEADQLAKMRARGAEPKDDKWKAKYEEPAAPDGSASPELPEGWEWATVEQVSTAVRYGTSAKTNDDRSGVPVLRMGNIKEGRLDLNALKYLPADHTEFPELLLQDDELLFNRTNSAELVGKVAVFHGHPHPVSFASYLIGVQVSADCSPDYLSYFINSVYGRAWVASVAVQQVGQANVNGTKLQALAFPLPPQDEQERIVAEVERRLSVVEQMETALAVNLNRADRLRQSILRDAFAGKLVPQDPADEPAAVLLERIRAERASSDKSAGYAKARQKRTKAKNTTDQLELYHE